MLRVRLICGKVVVFATLLHLSGCWLVMDDKASECLRRSRNCVAWAGLLCYRPPDPDSVEPPAAFGQCGALLDGCIRLETNCDE